MRIVFSRHIYQRPIILTLGLVRYKWNESDMSPVVKWFLHLDLCGFLRWGPVCFCVHIHLKLNSMVFVILQMNLLNINQNQAIVLLLFKKLTSNLLNAKINTKWKFLVVALTVDVVFISEIKWAYMGMGWVVFDSPHVFFIAVSYHDYKWMRAEITKVLLCCYVHVSVNR